jgi:hypothetical protein
MARIIIIKSGEIEIEAELNDTKTAGAIWKALPIEKPANIWGDEIYFTIPIKRELEKGQDVVEIGDLGYWPPGMAFCIFFGKTPISGEGEIRPASAVTVVGKIISDVSALKRVLFGVKVRISKR